MKKTIILLPIFTLALILRFHSFSDSPKSLYWDEVSIGYNAYSILQTGKDEWGRLLPWFFEAFGEFKFPVAIYLSAISIKFFGLTDFAVRFPSTFFGGLSVGAIYLLGIQIFRKRKIALLSAFALSVSPWSIQFSRGMFESNVAIFFLISAIYFLIKFLKNNNSLFFCLYSLSAFLCVYSYAIMLVALPLLTIMTVIVMSSSGYKEKIKHTLFFLSALFILYIPFFVHIKNDSYLRFNQVSIFSQNPVLEEVINLRIKYGGISGLIFNRYSSALINFGSNFASYINPRFLWPGKDGNPRHFNGFGLIYPIEFIFLAIGILNLFLSKKKRLIYLIVFLFVPFAVSSFTKDSPHALRSLCAVVPFAMIVAVGIDYCSKRKGLIFLIILSYMFLIALYLSRYYVHSFESFSSWGFENKSMMEEAKKMNLENKTVYFTGDYWRPYVYYYFYNAVSPSLVQKNNFSTRIKNVYFGYAKWDKADRRYDFNFKPESLTATDNYFMFLSPSEKEAFSKILELNGAHLLKNFYYNNSYIFSIYEK